MLAWVAASLGAQVSGLDYSDRGMATTKRLFTALQLSGDLRCQDLRDTTFTPGTFDFVYSVGVIEHFDDPRDVIGRHLMLVRPGGTALMTVPNYGGVYGRLQRYFDAKNLECHNLNMMTGGALAALVPKAVAATVRTYPAGRLSPWLISLGKRWPKRVALGVSYLANAAALLQPFEVAALCPMLVLEAVRATV
jgi:2-polyprenyl-3-methyl-5-hydroxy-6-metoxy-1,4-benzoquinol methylase